MKVKTKSKKSDKNDDKITTYVCMDFGTFICSRCSGILRELNFKVKGTGVSIFNQKEIDILEKNGNDVAQKIWMAKYKEGKDKKPNTKNDDELRKFLKDKYKNKKWYKKKKSSDDDDEEDEDKKKMIKKIRKKRTKRKKMKVMMKMMTMNLIVNLILKIRKKVINTLIKDLLILKIIYMKSIKIQ